MCALLKFCRPENKDESQKLYEELKNDHPDHLGAITAMMASLEPESKRLLPGATGEFDADAALAVIKLADEIIAAVDHTALLAYFGMKSDQSSEASTTKTYVNYFEKSFQIIYVWLLG